MTPVCDVGKHKTDCRTAPSDVSRVYMTDRVGIAVVTKDQNSKICGGIFSSISPVIKNPNSFSLLPLAQLLCAASSRAVSPLVVAPGDFSQPACPSSCLDNSAAKHKLGLRHKACTKRKPASVRHSHTHVEHVYHVVFSYIHIFPIDPTDTEL